MAAMTEHDKVIRVRDRMSLIVDFLEHVEKEHGMELCRETLSHESQRDEWFPVDNVAVWGSSTVSIRDLMLDFFGIDKEKLDAETAAIAARNAAADKRAADTHARIKLGEDVS